MVNENRPVQSHDSEHDVTEKVKPKRSSRKTLLIAAIVGVLTIGSLVVLRDQVDIRNSGVAAPDHRTTALVTYATNPDDGGSAKGKSVPVSGASETIIHAIDGLSDRINQWFESLRTEQSSVIRELSVMAASVSAIQESVAELRKSNDELKQHITAAQSMLQAISQDMHSLKVASTKKVAAQHNQAARVPPFHVDAIDLWDDAVYVAISQNGQVAFLREGEQRSGWQVTHIDRLKGQVALHGPEGQNYSTSIRRQN